MHGLEALELEQSFLDEWATELELGSRNDAEVRRFRILSSADLANLPPLRWRIRGVLPETGIAAIYGPSGSGKSFLALDALASVASGREWFGNRVMLAPVLYVALEGEAGIAQRVHACEDRYGRFPRGFKFILDGFDIRKHGDRAALAAAAVAAGYRDGVLCIDTLNRAAPGADENDSATMGAIIAAAKALQSELGGLILLVHHTGKDASKGLRGHSSLHAALDSAVCVSREGDRREWVVAKSKDGEGGKTHTFRLCVVEVGEDAEDGEPITSCVVEPLTDSRETLPKAKMPRGGNQLIVWQALGELFRAAGAVAPEGAPKKLPLGRPCVQLDSAIAAIRDRLPVESERKTERTRQAITGLISRGILEHLGGFLWCR